MLSTQLHRIFNNLLGFFYDVVHNSIIVKKCIWKCLESHFAGEANLFEEALQKYGKDFGDIQKDFVSIQGSPQGTVLFCAHAESVKVFVNMERANLPEKGANLPEKLLQWLKCEWTLQQQGQDYWLLRVRIQRIEKCFFLQAKT